MATADILETMLDLANIQQDDWVRFGVSLVPQLKGGEGKTDRYVYSEFTDPLTGVVDDVEFLFSKDSPLVNYRSAARSGGDDKRQRNRVRDLRKSLKPQGWKSVGRLQID